MILKDRLINGVLRIVTYDDADATLMIQWTTGPIVTPITRQEALVLREELDRFLAVPEDGSRK